jgi:outer membrane scaffolding protein for murein synthesis (MipA/OmpV family)
MARPQVADGGDGLQIWRAAANILNKQSQRADNGWSSSLGAGVGLTTHYLKKKQAGYEMSQRASNLDGFFGQTT